MGTPIIDKTIEDLRSMGVKFKEERKTGELPFKKSHSGNFGLRKRGVSNAHRGLSKNKHKDNA